MLYWHNIVTFPIANLILLDPKEEKKKNKLLTNTNLSKTKS